MPSIGAIARAIVSAFFLFLALILLGTVLLPALHFEVASRLAEFLVQWAGPIAVAAFVYFAFTGGGFSWPRPSPPPPRG